MPVTDKPKDDTYTQWLHYQVDIVGNIADLNRALFHGNTVAVSDGSYHEQGKLGAAAWVLANDKLNPIIKGKSMSPGQPSNQSAYQRKLVGVLAGSDYLQVTTNITVQKGYGITLYCDNVSVLGEVDEWLADRMTPKPKHADIISAMIKVQDMLHLNVQVEHVQAHQDDHKTIIQLTPQEKLMLTCIEMQKTCSP